MHILLAVEHILTSVITSLESLLGIWNVITSEAKKSPIYILNYFTTFLSFFFFFQIAGIFYNARIAKYNLFSNC